jgi:hypothetical protein
LFLPAVVNGLPSAIVFASEIRCPIRQFHRI